jgi:hypothetical protein
MPFDHMIAASVKSKEIRYSKKQSSVTIRICDTRREDELAFVTVSPKNCSAQIIIAFVNKLYMI